MLIILESLQLLGRFYGCDDPSHVHLMYILNHANVNFRGWHVLWALMSIFQVQNFWTFIYGWRECQTSLKRGQVRNWMAATIIEDNPVSRQDIILGQSSDYSVQNNGSNYQMCGQLVTRGSSPIRDQMCAQHDRFWGYTRNLQSAWKLIANFVPYYALMHHRLPKNGRNL